jgi:probable poly-beta-1,6-N-acetyl-D-glucosamine export protein
MRRGIDAIKGIAIVCVILIHCISIISSRISLYSPFNNISISLIISDQVLRFCVPLFVAVSGFTLTLSQEKKQLNYVDFLKRRVFKIIPLFLFWWIVIQVINPSVGYHLYFVPMILQLYLLFPIIYYFVKKLPLVTLLFALITQLSYFAFLSNKFLSDWNQYIICLSWIYYFVLGIYLYLQKINKFVVVLVPIGLYFSINMAFGWLYHGRNLMDALMFTRLPVIIYATGIISLLFLLEDHLKNSSLEFLGKHSYFIYLSHTLVLAYIFRILLSLRA